VDLSLARTHCCT